MRCLNILPTGTWNNFTEISLTPQLGTFEGTEFVWETVDEIEMELIVDTDGLAEWEGRYQGRDAGAEIAWSLDGMIGYMWVIGISQNDMSGYQPILYTTTDGGDSWDYVHLDFQTDEAQEMISEITPINWAGARIPRFTESCGVVNRNGELEIFANVSAHSADVFNGLDSLNWGWTYPGDIANFTIDIDGVLQNAVYVDSLNTENVLDGDDAEINYAGSTGWQHRIQAARNEDASQVFVTWTDTRNAEAEKNNEPDLFGWSKGICDNPITMERVCLTEGTLYEKFYYFNSSADIAFDNGNGYTIPTIQAITPGEFSSNTNAAANPITVNYITGIEFPVLCPVGIEDLTLRSNVTVSQNKPNPFNGTTSVNVSTTSSKNIIVEVSNLMGQSVYTKNIGVVNGTKEIILNSNNLEAGVYFYTVIIGSESITKKMIVE